jgi:hypothetical protein
MLSMLQWKAISKLITYSESVFVALYIQHATPMLDTWPALQYFYILPHKQHNLGKKFK